MTRKIFRTSLLVGLAALALSAGLFSWALVRHFTAKVYEELMVEVRLAAQGVRLGGRDYLEAVSSPARLTWIGGDGTVLFDTAAQAEGMDNHLDRPEIRDALSRGLGRDSRLSDTLSERTLYAALALEDGTVLRVVEEALSGRHSEALLEGEGGCCQLLASPVSHQGRPAGAVVAILDVTERQRREALRREFTANVSHELKPPLTSISGFAELMKGGLVPQETVPEFASDIYREAQRLIALVEDIIHLSQLDENALPMAWEPVDLFALAEAVLARLAPAAARAQVTLSLEGEPAEVEGVRHVLEEMIGNLVDNGVKYNRPGGSVAVAVGRREGLARLTVRDTGIGIPPAHQQRVFERFYRVDKSHSREVGGTGLGLSIVKHAAAYHGAALELESREGEGTAVTVQWR